MKKFILLTLLTVITFSCRQKQYSNSGPEIDAIKKAHEIYLKGDWAAFEDLYADTAKIFVNNWGGEPMTPEQFTMALKDGAGNYTEYKMGPDAIYEVIFLEDGKNYVHSWWEWQGTHRSGKKVTSVIHTSAQIVNGKIAWEGVVFNNLPFYLANLPGDSTVMK